MGCGGSKEKLTPAEKRAMMMQKAMKSANKPTQAQLNRRESTHLVINISEELQRWDGTNELENVKLEDRYQHVKALGAGAFGTVSKVERMGDLKMLAAKEILRERCVQQEQWQLALQETRTWKELSSPYHPAILQLIEVLYTADKSIYLLTEVMPGGELAEAFDHMEMTEQKCRLIAVQITAAIGHLHMAHSMAHRDVKPQNVLCRRRRNPMQVGCLKLADFGFCAKVESLTKPQFRLYCGSLDYFAPELAQMVVADKYGAEHGIKYGANVDCYALGCVVYEMLHGHPPYWNIDEDKQLTGIANAKGSLPLPKESFGNVSSACIDFMKKLLDVDPTKRMGIEAALAHKWLQPVKDDDLRIKMEEKSSKDEAEAMAKRRAGRRSSMSAKHLPLQGLSAQLSSENLAMANQTAAAPSGKLTVVGDINGPKQVVDAPLSTAHDDDDDDDDDDEQIDGDPMAAAQELYQSGRSDVNA